MIKKILATTLAILSISMFSFTTFADEVNLELEYTDSKQLITNTDDLFVNFNTVMPGDVYSDTLHIENNHYNSCELFFKSVPLSSNNYELDEDYKLLNEINLKIEYSNAKENKTVYDGKLSGTSISDPYSLGKFKKNDTGDFKFTISIPSELKNEYNMTSTKVKWYFGLSEDEIKEVSTPNTGVNKGINIVGIITIAGIAFVVARKNKKEVDTNE